MAGRLQPRTLSTPSATFTANSRRSSSWGASSATTSTPAGHTRITVCSSSSAIWWTAAHTPIADQLFTGAGIFLQAIDGQIARNIMLKFVELGRPCIGIHDSFFVWPEDEEQLKQLMVDEYLKYFPGFKPKVDTKKKKRANLPAYPMAIAA